MVDRMPGRSMVQAFMGFQSITRTTVFPLLRQRTTPEPSLLRSVSRLSSIHKNMWAPGRGRWAHLRR